MLRNYLKVTLRNIKKDKWFSLINVVGLTIGIAGSLLIYLHITHELSYDGFHDESENIYRVVRVSHNSSGDDYEPNVPYPLINALNNDFNQFERATLLHTDEDAVFLYEGEKFRIEQGAFGDSSFFEIFSYPVLTGDPAKSLSQPNFIFLSESMADVIFGKTDPIGQKLRLNNLLDLEVAGIFKDVPTNSSLQFDYVVSYPSFSSDYFGGLDIESWNMSARGFSYVKLKPGVAVSEAEDQFKVALKKYYSEQDFNRREFFLQPIREVHFNRLWNSQAVDTTTLWTIGIIGAFILLVGCVNFINLSTALAVRKSKEIGVRKTLGAAKGQLVFQFLGETFIVTVVSAILAVGSAERLVPLFNEYFDTRLALNIFENLSILSFLLAIVFVVTVMAGIYPALVLSGFNPSKALKNNIHSQSSASLFLRKGLIIVQFVISQVLIIATIIISSQMDYFFNKPLGFDKDAVINISLSENDADKLANFKQRVEQHAGVQKVSINLSAPLSSSTFETSYWPSNKTDKEGMSIEIKPADIDYMETYGLELLHGRWFTESDQSLALNIFDKKNEGKGELSYILNETAVRKLGYANPEEAIGEFITSGVGGISGPIIGIMKDYHTGTFHEAIPPVAILNFPMFYYNAGVKLSFNQSREVIAHAEDVYSQLYPEGVFEYEFMDDTLAEFYVNEQRAYNLLMVFSMLSIFISCLGLLGVISFVVNQKTKEVGVRKVLGASISSILMLFTKDFMILVLIAFVVAGPIAWYFMSNWLNNFAYQIDIEVYYFILGLAISGVITFLTISYQSLRAAISNPVNALRDE